MAEHFQKAEHWKRLESLPQIKCIDRTVHRGDTRARSSCDTNILSPLKSNRCWNVMKIIRDPNDIDLRLV